jgi:hypothetical protein
MADVPASSQTGLEKRYRTAALVVGVQILITLGLIGAAFFVAQSSDGSATSQAISGLWIIILIIALGTFVLRRFLFSRERLNKAFREKGVSGALETLQTNAILLGSLAEIITVFGFLIAVFGDKWDMFRVGVIALVVFLANFPRLSQWRKIVAGLENSRGS